MPDILLGFVCIIIGVLSVAAFLVAYEDNNRSGALAATISFAFAISLMLWLIAAANSDWKYITTDAYANIKFNNVTYTVIIYEDGNGHHVIELPYYLDNTKKYLVKIPDRNRYYKGILFTIDRPIKDWIKAEEIKAEQ